jgi:hypothetical protein
MCFEKKKNQNTELKEQIVKNDQYTQNIFLDSRFSLEF